MMMVLSLILRRPVFLGTVLLFFPKNAVAWCSARRGQSLRSCSPMHQLLGKRSYASRRPHVLDRPSFRELFESSGNPDDVSLLASGVVSCLDIDFTKEEQKVLDGLYLQCHSDGNSRPQAILAESLPSLRPTLLVKLRQLAMKITDQTDSSSSSSTDMAVEDKIRAVSRLLTSVLDSRLAVARETLLELLSAGEIRKLDAVIGSAARSGRLDAAFFNVLDLNMRDAKATERISDDETEKSSPFDNVNDSSTSATPAATPAKTSRVQILQHITTRCQEEMEKLLSPGTALLHKLLRTEQPSIRSNLYGHYLTPPKTTISSPDGKVIELFSDQSQNKNAPLVALDDFVGAMDSAVLQIRTLEQAKGTDRASAAIMVENCREVAKEARSIIGDYYGRESEELRAYEEGLQSVFRPSSRSSPYIQGENA